MAKNQKRTWRQQFMDNFKILTRSHDKWEVWSDFVHLAACTISNVFDKRFYDQREQRYLEIIQKYNKEEAALFAELLAITIIALDENPAQDFLGQIHQQELELGNYANGSFYTPYHVGEMMAELGAMDVMPEVLEEEYISVNDCCCGAGCLLIAFANTLLKHKVNYQTKVLFVAQDIDFTAAMACYIQLSFLGCAGYVVVGNSLSNAEPPPESIWYTPFYFRNIWVDRRRDAHWKHMFRILLTNGVEKTPM
jgi:type I restriction-modification system DNA methylase subunit